MERFGYLSQVLCGCERVTSRSTRSPSQARWWVRSRCSWAPTTARPVEATEPSRLRYAADGHNLLGDPAVTKLVAMGLAERLNFVTSYLADLKYQYGDAPGLSMVSDVLTRLAQHQGLAAQPGSARDPDPDY